MQPVRSRKWSEARRQPQSRPACRGRKALSSVALAARNESCLSDGGLTALALRGISVTVSGSGRHSAHKEGERRVQLDRSAFQRGGVLSQSDHEMADRIRQSARQGDKSVVAERVVRNFPARLIGIPLVTRAFGPRLSPVLI